MKADGRGLIRFWNYQLTNKITEHSLDHWKNLLVSFDLV